MNVLLIVAHPDDEVLGCGGSMAKWAKSRDKIHVLIMAEGATSRDEKRDRIIREKELSLLAKSAQKASEILGVQSVELLDYPDNRMDSVDLLDVVKTIQVFVEKVKPEMVVTHHSGDLNIDHQIVNQAVMAACRPEPGNPVKRILTFEVPSSTEWQSPSIGSPFVPNWFEDITEMLGMKIRALKAYQSEMRAWPHARSIESVEHLAHWRGATVGFEAAEAFMLVREIL